jgi:hypothetical protein
VSRLHELLRLRRHQETLADGTLAEATRTRLAAEAAYEELTRPDTVVSSEPQPHSLAELVALRMQGIAAQEVLARAAETMELRRRDETDARAARTAAAVRRRSVQRAVERRELEHMLAAQRAARHALAELARLQAVQE